MRPFRKHTSAMPRTKARPFGPLRNLFAALALAASLPAAAATAPAFTPHAREMERLAEQTFVQSRIPGMAMAIVQDGQVLSLKGYGVVDSKTREPVGTDTAFRLASLSKSFAGTLSSLLVQEGAMAWDTPITNQLPGFRLRDMAGARRITLRQLLSHRVGLAYNTYDRMLEANEPYPLLAEKLSEAPLTCSPGDCYAYQNIAFSLVGDLVFAATGDFYAHQVEKRLFHPLGMYGATSGREGLEACAAAARGNRFPSGAPRSTRRRCARAGAPSWCSIPARRGRRSPRTCRADGTDASRPGGRRSRPWPRTRGRRRG